MPGRFIISKLLQRYWRISRGMTLGAQAALLDDSGRIMLIRHTYQKGWRFPGGGVEKGEAVSHALIRELDEEVGVELTGEPELFGIYSNAPVFPNDHIAFFVARSWRQVRVPEPNYEIAEHRLFHPSALPEDLSPGTARRIGEIMFAKPRSRMW